MKDLTKEMHELVNNDPTVRYFYQLYLNGEFKSWTAMLEALVYHQHELAKKHAEDVMRNAALTIDQKMLLL